MTKISVVMPSYNQGEYLAQAINSVLCQSYSNTELIVIDGGSTDNSKEILESYSNQLTYWCSEKDNGQAHAINKGFNKATGDILCWLNSDDLLQEGSLEFVKDNLDTNKASWLIGASQSINSKCQKRKIRKAGKISINTFLQYKQFWFPQPSVFWTRKMWAISGKLNENLNYIMDLDYFYRMYCQDAPTTTEIVLSSYTVHPQAKTSKEANLVDLEYASWLKQLMLEDQSEFDITNEILKSYIHLQRCQRTASEHIVISNLIKFWKKYINKNLII